MIDLPQDYSNPFYYFTHGSCDIFAQYLVECGICDNLVAVYYKGKDESNSCFVHVFGVQNSKLIDVLGSTEYDSAIDYIQTMLPELLEDLEDDGDFNFDNLYVDSFEFPKYIKNIKEDFIDKFNCKKFKKRLKEIGINNKIAKTMVKTF